MTAETQTDQWEDTDDAAMALVVQAEAVQITDRASFEAAVHFRAGIKALIAEIQGTFKPIKQAQDAAKKATLAQERDRLQQPEYALGLVNQALERWDRQQREELRKAEIAAAREAKELGTPVPARPVPQAKTEGFGFTTHYHASVLDLRTLLEAVLRGKASLDLLQVNQALADDFARTAGPQTTAAEKPGVAVPMPDVPGLGIVAERRPRGK